MLVVPDLLDAIRCQFSICLDYFFPVQLDDQIVSIITPYRVCLIFALDSSSIVLFEASPLKDPPPAHVAE